MDPQKKHSCKELLARVALAIDGEMSKEEEASFLAEIQQCHYCLEKYQIETSFKQFLCNKVNKKECSGSLISEIRNRIHSAFNGSAS
jgi:anti-sigma factor (TIGR02949 family)